MDPAAARTPVPPPSAESPAAAPAAASLPPPRRLVRNYLLDTSLQLRLASYLVAAATILSIGLGWLLWSAYRETSRVVALGDPDAAEPLAQALAAEDQLRIVAVAVALAAILVCLLAAAVVVTHRIAGPAYVLGRTCRDVAEGRLTPPRPLRARDLLVDLASDVAAMVEALRGREADERGAVVRAAATLRNPGASTAERASAAEALERLAAEKEARLAP